MKYYGAIKRKEILIHGMVQMNLENIMISVRNQSERTSYCGILFR
jgi:hypothetical protein